MRERYSTSKLPAMIESASGLVPRDIKYVLRGISQVIIVNNSLSGIVILSALYVGGGALLGTLALSCAVVSTLLAKRAYSDVDSVKSGLEGYNACLVGCAFSVFVSREWDAGMFFAGLFCGVASSFVNLSLKAFFNIPTFTFAFNLTIIAYVLFGMSDPGPLPDLPPTAINIILCPLRGISQIWVVNSWVAGSLILVGVAIDSVGIALYALCGSIVGCITGYIFGGDDNLAKVLNGLHGFNSSLMACAIAVFYVPSIGSVCFGISACVFTEFVTLGLGNLFDRAIHTPSFTLPFSIVAAACHLILSDGALRGLHGAISPTSPESNYYQHRIRMMMMEEEEEEEEKKEEERGTDATMKVFYGPSAVTIKKNHSNYIDRVQKVNLSTEDADGETSFRRVLHNRPHAQSSRLIRVHDDDEELVLASINRRAALVRAASVKGGARGVTRRNLFSGPSHGGAAFTSSAPVQAGGLKPSTAKPWRSMVSMMGSLPPSIVDEGNTDTPDVESGANTKEMDITSSTKDTHR
jgi:urea transporter